MKQFIKDNVIWLLFTVLLSLLFILWGRIVLSEFRANTNIHNLVTQNDRLRCLSAYGWEVDPGSETVKSVLIPEPLDAVFKKYNQLQRACGFDLEKYAGESVQCYTYQILNFPYETQEVVYVNLLISEGKLIGGDCMMTAIDGFMLPLDRRCLP